ncbi:phage terminase large subunit [Paenibacillus alkaliterrae]|uniref:phage terminase large subunit n=1 Tax=Paenibacillus alkaliterrae TaxID=320909 RepID=UPI001F16B964|nr:phage terminase large subunit [Paenibacillus alkaliterrae]MCF2938912.1 phage terminase large subunit [Paenibacillus alkaliterrae]
MLKLSQAQLKAIEEQATYELARRDFSYFVDVDSEFRDRDGAHLDVLDDTLIKVSEGTLKRVIVTMPPRHGKSERVSKKFPAWHVGRNPGDEIILASYSVDLSRGFSRIARDTLIANRDMFGVSVDPANQSAESWGTEGYRGGVTAAGVGGAITGKGAKIAIIDDPVKNAEEANSEVMREKVWDWYQSTLYTRLTPDGCIIVVMTRWHEDDLVGRLLKKEADEIREGTHKGEQWTVINFPAIAESNDFLGRKEGEPLWPEFGFDAHRLEQIKSDVGSYVFNALYQQRPSAAGGTIFKREHFRYFKRIQHLGSSYLQVGDKKYLESACWKFQTVDTANSEKTINDPFVVSTWITTPDNDLLLDDVYRTRITGPDQKPLMKQMVQRFKPKFQAIEDKTFGTNLIQECTREGMNIKPIKVDKDKVTRSLVIAARYEVGKVYHREDAKWLTDYEDELLSFPRGKHDDQVDTASMAGEIVHSFVAELKPWSATPEYKPNKSTLDSDFDDFAQNSASSVWG